MIDIGTTTLQAAHHLHGRDITVVTTSLAVYEELAPDPAIELVLPGGVVRRNYRSLVGVLAEDSLRQLKADVLFLGTSAVDAELAVWDSTMVEVPIKRAMIEAAESVALLADAEKFSMAGLVRVCDGRRARPHRHRRARCPAACPRRHRRDRNRGHHRMKLTIVGGGGFRVPLVYGALLEQAERLGLDEVVLHDIDARGSSGSPRCSTGSPPSTARGCRSARRPTSTTRSRAPTTSSARSASASSRAASSTRASRSASACSGRRRPGPGGICFALRTIPAMVALAQAIARARAEGVADQLHQPRGHGHRGGPAGARRARGRHLRLAVRPVPPRRRARSAAIRASCGSTTSASTTSAGSRACATRGASCCRGLLDDDARAGGVRGGPAVRRRVAALARDDPERVPLLLLLRGRHRRRDPREPGVARRVPARAAAPRSTPATGRTRPAALAAWRATRHDRERTYMAEARSRRGRRRRARRTTRTAATRARRWPCWRRSRSTRARC